MHGNDPFLPLPIKSFDEELRAFEATWQRGEVPDLPELARRLDRPELLAELALVDLEYRWRAPAAVFEAAATADRLGQRPTLREYVEFFPALGAIAAQSPEWQGEEFRVRSLWGDRPSAAQFARLYPEHGPSWPQVLAAIERELAAEEVPQVSNLVLPRATGFDPRAPLPAVDYVLEKLLGRGGMGKVYRARQLSLGRRVAVKALLKVRQAQPGAVERFVQEAQILARLRHPNIVGVHGLGRFRGGGYFIAMDLVEGGSLQSRVEEGPLAVEAAVQIVRRVAHAVAYAHENGVIHCDLKPANVLLASEVEPVVTDFGLAQLAPREPSNWHLAEAGPSPWVGGTLGYMAPELVADRGSVRVPAIDVFGLGALLYALLTGKAPLPVSAAAYFPGVPGLRPVSPPSQSRAGIDRRLDELCRQSLEFDPESRMQTAWEFAKSLEY
jgi:eukaryotic-like serine/threonine-protein kinase